MKISRSLVSSLSVVVCWLLLLGVESRLRDTRVRSAPLLANQPTQPTNPSIAQIMDRKTTQRRKQLAEELALTDGEYVRLLRVLQTHYMVAATTAQSRSIASAVAPSSRVSALSSPSFGVRRRSASSCPTVASPSPSPPSVPNMVLSEDEARTLFGNLPAVIKCASELATAVRTARRCAAIYATQCAKYSLGNNVHVLDARTTHAMAYAQLQGCIDKWTVDGCISSAFDTHFNRVCSDDCHLLLPRQSRVLMAVTRAAFA